MRELKLKYYVINGNFSKDTSCAMFNIFDNNRVYESTIKEVKRYCRNTKKYSVKKLDYETHEYKTLYGHEAFVEQLRSIIAWQEWGRVEYEIGVTPWSQHDVFKAEEIEEYNFMKTDCYEQFLPNKELVADYIIDRYKEYLKEQRKTKK